MLIFNRLENSRKLIIILDLLKISFIVFVAFSFLALVIPYYNETDSYIYANTAINLAETGEYGFSNELLKETDKWEFVPWIYKKTVDNVAVPTGAGLGMHGISTLAYLVGGHYGLFYLTPIFSILLIIAVDRICINLFGRFVAFVAVILTGTNWVIHLMGLQLLSESIFTFFFIIGIFFLVKFFRSKNEIFILLCSAFLVTAAFIRFIGIISFPLEIILVLGFLFLPKISQSHINIKSKTTSNSFLSYFKKNQKKIFRTIVLMSIPWIFFFVFIAAYNSYNFGDPFLGPLQVTPSSTSVSSFSPSSVFNKLSLDFFQWITYGAGLQLPDKLLSIFTEKTMFQPKENTELGIISLLIIFLALVISFLSKIKRPEIIILCLFIFGIIALNSLNWIRIIPNLEEYGLTSLNFNPQSSIRYMLPAFPLFYMLFGFIMHKIWKINTETIPNIHIKNLTKILKLGFLALVISFLVTSFYDSNSLQYLFIYNIFNPQESLEYHFPIDFEGLPEKSVIVGAEEYKAVEMGKIPFFPYRGFNFFRINYEPESIPQEPIQTLKQLLEAKTTTGPYSILNEGYQVFVLKEHWYFDTTYYYYLQSHHGIILKDYSKSFCKMELVSELSSKGIDPKPDEICY